METIPNAERPHASTPDSFLGSSSTRYFSAGFKKIDHFIETVTVKDGNLLANLKVAWPDCWSEKKGIQRKHTVNHTMISASSFPAKDPLVDLSYILVFCERHLSAILWGLCY